MNDNAPSPPNAHTSAEPPHLLQIPGGLTLGQLKLDPIYDPIRADPRVQELPGQAPAKA